MCSPDPRTARDIADEQEIRIWGALRSAARGVREAAALEEGMTYAVGPDERLYPVSEESPNGLLTWQPPAGWLPSSLAPAAAQALLDLYLPICNASATAPLTVGHLGQGLDGYIATSSGDSSYVTGPENILHLHRMRALCDAVLVGADTVATDDPQLTARRARGDHPVRVILDPQRRLASTHRVFSDRAAPTLLVCDAARVSETPGCVGTAEVMGIPTGATGLDLEALLDALHARQLYAVFVEGGGKTVSAFLEQGLLDRLQIAVAPVVTGVGRPGIRLPAKQHMHECLRLSPRIFVMGEDVLFDCDLRRVREEFSSEHRLADRLSRIV